MQKKSLIFATEKCITKKKNMEKLDFQAIVDSKLNFHCNDHIAIFNDFEEVRNLNISDLLIEGFLFAVVTHGQAQISVGDKMYQLKKGDLITCKPRNIFEKSMMSMDFNALVLFLSPEYVAQLSQMVRMEWTYSMFSSSYKILHADEMAIREANEASYENIDNEVRLKADKNGQLTFDDLPDDDGTYTKSESEAEPEVVKNILAHDLHVIVNNEAVTLHGKADYIFVDIFDAIDFDLSKPEGRSIVTMLNGSTPDYMQSIKEGDKIEVYWK